MRGRFQDQGGLFSYRSPEARAPPRHCAANQRARSHLGLSHEMFQFGKDARGVSIAART
jgi:hypothetical protein